MLRQAEQSVDVVISGMSIAAMSCAYEALKAGKSVYMISNRGPEFSRGQRVVLDIYTREYLTAMHTDIFKSAEDKKFIDKLNNDVSISIKNIERFLFRRLIDEFAHTDRLHVAWNSSLTKVDFHEGMATCNPIDDCNQQATCIKFTYLIGADGVKRNAYRQVMQDLTDTQRAEISLQSEPVITHHLFAEATLTAKNGDVIPLNAEDLIVSFAHHSKAALYSKAAVNTGNYFYTPVKLVCSVPEAIAAIDNDDDRQLAINHYALNMISTLIVKAGLNPDNINLTILSNTVNKRLQPADKSPTLFQIQVQKCHKAFLSVNDHHFIIAGDAFRTSEYDYGHGANDALSHAKKLGSFFRRKCSLQAYDSHCQKLAAIIDRRKEQHAMPEANPTSQINSDLEVFRRVLHGRK
jgi:2-polyprenyl-6-methoxyphenol hydroxylase-like FAD-dependent oxidoreductase